VRRRGEGARETIDCFQSRVEKTMGVMQLWVRIGLEGVTRGRGERGERGEGRYLEIRLQRESSIFYVGIVMQGSAVPRNCPTLQFWV
jgi:hypothetical protein